MSPQIKDILTACIPARFRGSRSFAIQGPVKLIEDCDSKLSNVFYLDIDCPFSSAELLEYFLSFESTVRYFKKHRINRDKDQVDLGSFVVSALILQLFLHLLLTRIFWRSISVLRVLNHLIFLLMR